MYDWIRVHGWPAHRNPAEDAPEVMFFQARHICGVYQALKNETPCTALLFVNCEHMVHESVEDIQWALGLAKSSTA